MGSVSDMSLTRELSHYVEISGPKPSLRFLASGPHGDFFLVQLKHCGRLHPTRNLPQLPCPGHCTCSTGVLSSVLDRIPDGGFSTCTFDEVIEQEIKQIFSGIMQQPSDVI